MSLLEPGYSLLALVAAFLAGLVVGRLTSVTKIARRERTRTQDIDRKMDASDALAVLPPEARIEIDTLVAEGRKIEAIRLCRAALGIGLEEAKHAVELIEATNTRGARAP